MDNAKQIRAFEKRKIDENKSSYWMSKNICFYLIANLCVGQGTSSGEGTT